MSASATAVKVAVCFARMTLQQEIEDIAGQVRVALRESPAETAKLRRQGRLAIHRLRDHCFSHGCGEEE